MRQELAHPFPIEWDEVASALEPREVPFSERIVARIRHMLLQASAYNDRTPASDVAWVGQVIERAKDALDDEFKPCFVMEDYKGHKTHALCVIITRTTVLTKKRGLIQLWQNNTM